MKKLKLINQSKKSILKNNEMVKIRGGSCICYCTAAGGILRHTKRGVVANNTLLEVLQ